MGLTVLGGTRYSGETCPIPLAIRSFKQWPSRNWDLLLGEEGSCCQSDGNLPPTKISYSSDIIRPPCRRDNDGGWVHTLTRNVWPTYLLSSVETSVRALKMDWGGGGHWAAALYVLPTPPLSAIHHGGGRWSSLAVRTLTQTSAVPSRLESVFFILDLVRGRCSDGSSWL